MSVRALLRLLVGPSFAVACLPLLMGVALQTNANAGAPASLSGVVVEEHGDDFAADTEHEFLTLVTAKDRFSLTGPGLGVVRAGQHVTVSGRLTGGTMYVASSAGVQPDTADQLSTAEMAASGATESLAASAQTKKVAVLLINFAGPTPSPTVSPTPCVPPTPAPTDSPTSPPDPSASPSGTPFVCPTPAPTPSPTAPPPQPWTTTQVAGYYFNNNKSVASFYRDLSNGSLTVAGNVFGWFTLNVSTATCDYNGFATAARAAATAAGIDLSVYTNVSYAMAKVSACDWGGLGVVNGPYSWINGDAAMGVYVPTHELGHNFGSPTRPA